jgi:hypothetical protein
MIPSSFICWEAIMSVNSALIPRREHSGTDFRRHALAVVGKRFQRPLGLLVTVAALGIALTTNTVAAPQITTDQILERARRAPNVRTTPAGVPGVIAKDAGTLDTIGEAPPGFGSVFSWNRSDAEIVVVAFLNSADPMGIAIVGVKNGDRLIVESATGIASFSEGNGKLIAGIISVVATAAEAGAAVIGAPEAAPIIQAGAAFATQQYGQPSRGKQRDPFGLEGRTLRRCEGGVLIAFPNAGGVYDSKGGCVKGPDDTDGNRSDIRRPDHMKDAVFLMRSVRERTIDGDGVLSLVSWDRKFEDNQGHYRLILRLTRADAVPPVIIERRDPRRPPGIPR